MQYVKYNEPTEEKQKYSGTELFTTNEAYIGYTTIHKQIYIVYIYGKNSLNSTIKAKP
jgi:hypothetical protein